MLQGSSVCFNCASGEFQGTQGVFKRILMRLNGRSKSVYRVLYKFQAVSGGFKEEFRGYQKPPETWWFQRGLSGVQGISGIVRWFQKGDTFRGLQWDFRGHWYGKGVVTHPY